MSDCVAILSGGMDSTTMVHKLVVEGKRPLCVGFFYGQKHHKELDYAHATAGELSLEFEEVDLSPLGELLTSSALTSEDQVIPEGHYAADNMKQTVVPNRNMIMLSMACGIAISQDLNVVYAGVHAGDHYVYPDCRPEFFDALVEVVRLGNKGFAADNFDIKTPFIMADKADIAEIAIGLNVAFSKTWSCYKGEENHCGRCGTCVERLEAIDEAAARVGKTVEEIDKTVYDDPEFWKEAVVKYAATGE